MGTLLKRVKFIHYITPEEWEALGERDRVSYEDGYIVEEMETGATMPSQISLVHPGNFGAYI